jgi:hypothetical protein
MNTIVSLTETAKTDTTPQRMAVPTRIIIGAIVVLFAVLHVGGIAMIVGASDRPTAQSPTVLRGD